MLVSALQWHESAISIHVPPPSWTAFPPLIPHSQVLTKHGAEIPVLHSSFPLAIHFTLGRWIGSIYEALRKWQPFSTISTNVIYFLGQFHRVFCFGFCLFVFWGFFFFFSWATQLAGSEFPDQVSNPGLWHWEWEVLTTRCLGNSMGLNYFDTHLTC